MEDVGNYSAYGAPYKVSLNGVCAIDWEILYPLPQHLPIRDVTNHAQLS